MRIVVSGTHASGKSTVVADFALRHPEFTVLPDPFELLDETWDRPDAGMFAAQLRIAATRLGAGAPELLVAERGPIDFLAYLLALEELHGATDSRELLKRSMAVTREAMERVDLLVLLPLTAGDGIAAGADEHLALREAMNDLLLELADDPDVTGDRAEVVELTGSRGRRLAALEAEVARFGG